MALKAFMLAMACTAVMPLQALAAHSCEYVFAAELTTVPEAFYQRLGGKPLNDKSIDSEKTLANVLKLTEKLFQANSRNVEQGRVYNPIRLSDYSVESVKLMPGKFADGYGVFIVKLKSRVDEDDISYEYVRSNGVAAFMDKSLQFRQEGHHDPLVKRYKAAYLEHETVRLVDQGEVYLSSLPDQIQLSRVMNASEKIQWARGNPIKVGPFGAKTHFAVNYFKFQGNEPVLIPFSKQELLQAYRRGDVEVNTYDVLKRDEIWTGKIDLEFEVVFNGLKAMESLRPHLQKVLVHQTAD
ncbi:hypothetical protein [Bdellovibrio sp. HCB209]|uniref:hypothetical protein n=1 Tax=Bdellovibrio sp. HCB209 TaxID=3394354 RepID=UPI0039B4776D